MTRQSRNRYLTVLAVLSLLGLVLILLDHSVTVAVGTSLIAGAVIGGLELWYRAYLEGNAESVSDIIDSGLVGIAPHRALEEYAARMARVMYNVDVSGFALRSFYESHRRILEERLQATPGLKVRFLVVDPCSAISKDRERREGHPVGTFEASVARLIALSKNYPEQAEVRKLEGELTTMFFRIDSFVYVGPQFASSASRATVTFKIHDSGKSWLYDAYQSEFDHAWDSANPA